MFIDPNWQPGISLTRGERLLQQHLEYQQAIARVLRERGKTDSLLRQTERPVLTLVAGGEKDSPGGLLPTGGEEDDSPSKNSEQSSHKDSYVAKESSE